MEKEKQSSVPQKQSASMVKMIKNREKPEQEENTTSQK